MSAKKHILVPHHFTEDDFVPGSVYARSARAAAHEFHRMSGREATALARQGKIRALGESGKVWQLAEDSFARPSRETGDGRISLEVPFSIQAMLAGEMRRRPAWCVTI
ncbi:MAG: hypothetical protein ACRD4R_06775 [Candidatus Acidiferrales bacterium]